MPVSRRNSRYDTDITSFLLLLLSFCVVPVFFSFRDGSEVMFYAGFPMLFAAVSITVSMGYIDALVAGQVQKRMRKKRGAGAALFCRTSLLAALYAGILKFFVFFVLSGFIGRTVLGYSLIPPILRMFTPAICLISFLGCLKGILRGIGQERIARISIWVQTAAFLVLGIAFGLAGSLRGQKVGVLLRNADIRAAYCACGIALGFDIATAVALVYLAVMCFLTTGRIRHQKEYRDEFDRPVRREDPRELMHWYWRNLVPAMIPALVFILGIMVGYSLWRNGQSSNTRLLISRWGGYMGIGFPLVTGCGLIAAMPFTGALRDLIRENESGHGRQIRAKGALLLRLSGYVSIPWSAFLFGAAKEIVGLFPNLTFRAQEAAILTIKAGCFQVFLLQSMVLVQLFFWKTGRRRAAIIAVCTGFFFQIILEVILKLAGTGITLDAWTLDVSMAVSLGVCAVTAASDRSLRLRFSWLSDDILTAICAGLADIPVILLNDYLLEVMAAFPAFLTELVLFYLIFIILSILLRAADLQNIRRIPGGGLVAAIAGFLVGAADEDVNS